MGNAERKARKRRGERIPPKPAPLEPTPDELNRWAQMREAAQCPDCDSTVTLTGPGAQPGSGGIGVIHAGVAHDSSCPNANNPKGGRPHR